jgi:hypothetical protein
MPAEHADPVPVHALFGQRLAGDDALLALAQLRFEQSALAAETYAGSAEELDRMLSWAPRSAHSPIVHLPRDLDLLDPAAPSRVQRLARHAADRVGGFVVHDRRHFPDRLEDLRRVAAELDAVLTEAGPARLFVEYAAGVHPWQFVEVGEQLRGTERIGVCVDTGHVGIRQARRHFAARRSAADDPDAPDLAGLSTADARLPDLIDDVQAAVAAARGDLLDLVGAVGRLGVPVHAHLHDGHPLVDGLADHFSFLTRWPLPFTHDGRGAVSGMFGVTGLVDIIAALRRAAPGRLSLTLEIHQWQGRLPLADAAGRFGHWQDLTNAERTNAWLAVLADNAMLTRAALSWPDGPGDDRAG